jgi:uncharacterized membrane protein YbhN (UPF0104 family)
MGESTAASIPAPPEQPVKHRLARIVAWLVGIALLLLVCNLLGVDIRGWLADVWDTVNDISFGYIVAGCFFQTLQTSLNALAWVYILRAAYPAAGVRIGPIIACYAVGVALNGVLPANLGTFVMLLMYLAIVPGSTFPGILAGYLVHKIFFTVVGGLVYLYLFLSVPGSFDRELGGITDHAGLATLIVVGGIVLIVLLIRIFWNWVKKLWEKAKQGGVILQRPKEYFLKVFLPQCGGYAARLAVIAVFLAAYSIPVTFHSVMAVVGSNSLANVTAVTPGSIGVTQAANVAALKDYTDSETATAYSISQQLITTAWNQVFAIILVCFYFGWSGGRELVGSSYKGAKVKAAEMKADRKQNKSED